MVEKKIRLGKIHADCLTFSEALRAIELLIEAGEGGFVVTPNVDHVVLAEHDERLRDAYTDASLSLADGMPLIWMSHILGTPLPEKISGSDLVVPLLRRAATLEKSVYFLGSAEGVGEEAGRRLKQDIESLNIVGTDSPPFGFEQDETEEERTMQKVIDAKPDVVLFALGCPKQELLMHKWYKKLAPSILLGIGASLDFLAGNVKRSPRWMSKMGLEWMYRLSQDPQRLAKRYLGRDLAILPIFLRMFVAAKGRTSK